MAKSVLPSWSGEAGNERLHWFSRILATNDCTVQIVIERAHCTSSKYEENRPSEPLRHHFFHMGKSDVRKTLNLVVIQMSMHRKGYTHVNRCQNMKQARGDTDVLLVKETNQSINGKGGKKEWNKKRREM